MEGGGYWGRLSEISGGERSWSRWGWWWTEVGRSDRLGGHCERDRFSSHTHNDCVTGDCKGTASGPGEFSRTEQNAREGGVAMGSVTQELSQAFLGFSSTLSHPRWTPNPTPSRPLPLHFHLPVSSPSQAFVHHLVPFPVYTLVLVSLSHFFLSTPAAISKPFVFVLPLWTPTLREGGALKSSFFWGSRVLSSIISTWPLSPHALSFHFISHMLCVCVHGYLCEKIKIIGPHLHSYFTAQWVFHVC